MKLSVERQPFLSELQLVTRAAATRSAIPALGGVMLKATGDTLALSATDTEIALQSSMPADVEQEGTLLLPARLLLDIVRVADGDTVSIDAASDQGVVKVTSQRASFAVRTLPAADFPKLPSAEPRGLPCSWTPARLRPRSTALRRRRRATRRVRC